MKNNSATLILVGAIAACCGWLITVTASGVGCGHGSTVCGIIDLASDACDVLHIRYLGPDGKPVTVAVPKDKAKKLAERIRKNEHKASDAGADHED